MTHLGTFPYTIGVVLRSYPVVPRDTPRCVQMAPPGGESAAVWCPLCVDVSSWRQAPSVRLSSLDADI